MLNRLLDRFKGKLTTSKWAKLAKCSQDTAYETSCSIVERGALRRMLQVAQHELFIGQRPGVHCRRLNPR